MIDLQVVHSILVIMTGLSFICILDILLMYLVFYGSNITSV
jgi:hypothetical protein